MNTKDWTIGNVSTAQLRMMPLHAITEVYGEPGLRHRLTLELDALPDLDRLHVATAAAWATDVHAGQRRTREPYINHVLRVTVRMLCYYRVTDPDVLVAGLLHDAVEDQPWAVADVPAHRPAPRVQALATIAARHNPRVARLVAAVTTPDRPAEADRIRHYLDHLIASLQTEPWARVIKLSDFTDNAVGIIHATGPLVTRSAHKYRAAVPILRDLLDRPDTPLPADVKAHIRGQLDLGHERIAAILAA